MVSVSHSGAGRWSRSIAIAAGLIVAAIGLLVLAGWALDVGALKSILPSWISMKSNTALAFTLAGLALLLRVTGTRSHAAGAIAGAAAALIMLGGVLTLAEYAFGVDTGIDQLPFREPPGARSTTFPGRMALTTAIDFILSGGALLFLDRVRAWAAQAPAALVFLIALLGVAGYLYSTESLQQIGPQFIAMHTAITFLILSTGILAARPGAGLSGLIGGRDAGGLLLRRLLPAIILVPFALGGGILAGSGWGLYSTKTGWALFSVATVVIMGALVLRSAAALSRLDRAHRESEERRAESHATLRAVLESVQAPVFSVDRDFRYTSYNNAHASSMRDIHGAEISIGGNLPGSLSRTGDRESTQRNLEQALRGETLTETVGPGTPGHGRRYVEIVYRPIQDAVGNILGVSVFAHDITVHKERLEEERDLLLTLVNSVPDPVYIKDRDLRFVLANRAAAELVGASEPAELVGKTDRDLFPRELAERYEAIDRGVLQSAQARHNTEEESEPRGGTQRWFLTTKVPLVDKAGHVNGLVGISREITDRKAFETRMQETQKLESLGVLAGGIAHDFNNILMVILGNAEVAGMRLGPDEAPRRNLDEIARSAQRAAELCRQLLAYAGKGSYQVTALDLGEMVREMGGMLRLAISKRATLNLALEPDLPSVQADVAQMRQIVMNLVINASEALQDGAGIISVTTAAIECSAEFLQTLGAADMPPGRCVRIRVTDTGTGMGQATKARMFEPFFTTKFIGRGLGLAAVLGIVRSHHGAIRVESEPGAGSRFELYFPAGTAKADPLLPPAGECAEWQGSGTVLVVDDEESVRGAARAMLEAIGFCVLTARDGSEALGVFRAHRDDISCVLLDLTMPGMDGAETFAHLQAIRSDVKVILSSGHDEQQTARRYQGAGFSGFLQKPFQVSVLRDRMRHVVEGGE